MIREENGQHCLYSQDGSRRLGCYPTREAAEARERQIEMHEGMIEALDPGSLTGRVDRVRVAFRQQGDRGGFPAISQGGGCSDLIEIYPDAVVCRNLDGYWRVSYTMEGSAITFGAPERVALSFGPLTEAEATILLEALDAEGRAWDVDVIRAGFSRNMDRGLPRYYPAAVIAAAAPLVEGARVYAHSPSPALVAEHVAHPDAASPRDVVGWLDRVHVAGDALRARFNVTAGWLREALLAAWQQGKRDLYSLSIEAGGEKREGEAEGRRAMIVEAIRQVFGVALVTRPAAGSGINGLIESAPATAAGEEDPMTAQATQTTQPPAGGAPAPDVGREILTEAQRALDEARRLRCESLLEARLAGARLPEPVTAKIRKRFAGQLFEATTLDETIREEKEVLDRLTESGTVIGAGEARATVTEDQRLKWQTAMDNMFSPKPEEHRKGFKSLRESWRAIAGPGREFQAERILFEALVCAPRISDKWEDMPRLAEALNLRESLKTSDWAEIFNVSAYKRLISAYGTEDYQKWRKLVSSYSNLSNFQTVRRVRYGGYGLLPTISEQGTYQPLTSPTDEEATYSASKRGGTEDLTWEMVLNDDLGAIRDIFRRLGLAAVITLYSEMIDFLRNNPSIYDGATLFDATNHGSNTAAAAGLASATLKTGIRAMRDQTAYGNTTQVLGSVNKPRYLWVPNELEDVAFRLTRSATYTGDTNEYATTPNVIRERYDIEVVVVDDFTDANDWFLTADPDKMPTIEVGFLNGQEEPELFVQDDPRVGSVFSADKITYKIRHVHGKAVLDWRSFYRGQG